MPPRPTPILGYTGLVTGQIVADSGGDTQIQKLGYSGDTPTVTNYVTVGTSGVGINGVLIDTSQPVDGQVLTYSSQAGKIKFAPATGGTTAGNIDGGAPNSVYGGTTPIDGGTP